MKRGAVNGSALAAAYAGARPVAERLLYDDDLRDNIRVLIESSRKVLDELSDESPQEIVARLWDDDKVRDQVESAVGAIQEGSKRVRGEKVRKRGGGSGRLLLVLAAGAGFLFLSPRTGPQARRIAGDIFKALRSG
ncbi:hypothetical protein GBA65_17810 [Rubrobacter marinus]|uniref:Uncharacterized protein n=1 Tax=Rubrobacter marinus TaxID=2653852 RepID=A0A6G8Q0P8_9ACTN|nr:hypothetical protein [Rubrobacter marinus]QIN80069.1 hypothetical protein GBA65_17810 [Rubrobacter marinus]